MDQIGGVGLKESTTNRQDDSVETRAALIDDATKKLVDAAKGNARIVSSPRVMRLLSQVAADSDLVNPNGFASHRGFAEPKQQPLKLIRHLVLREMLKERNRRSAASNSTIHNHTPGTYFNPKGAN